MSVHTHTHHCHCRRYGFLNLAFDFVMTVITGGLWLIWVAVRYLRTH